MTKNLYYLHKKVDLYVEIMFKISYFLFSQCVNAYMQSEREEKDCNNLNKRTFIRRKS